MCASTSIRFLAPTDKGDDMKLPELRHNNYRHDQPCTFGEAKHADGWNAAIEEVIRINTEPTIPVKIRKDDMWVAKAPGAWQVFRYQVVKITDTTVTLRRIEKGVRQDDLCYPLADVRFLERIGTKKSAASDEERAKEVRYLNDVIGTYTAAVRAHATKGAQRLEDQEVIQKNYDEAYRVLCANIAHLLNRAYS
jgi:hypothetical protein